MVDGFLKKRAVAVLSPLSLPAPLIRQLSSIQNFHVGSTVGSKRRNTTQGPTVRAHIRNGARTGSWQVDIPARLTDNGRRRRVNFPTRKEADAYAARMVRQLQVRSLMLDGVGVATGVSFEEAADQWWKEQLAAGKAGLKRRSTLETNSHQLKRLLKFFGRYDLAAINRTKVMEYQAQRSDRDDASPETINSETARLKQVLGWAQSQGLCKTVARFQSLPVRQRQPDLPTPEEIARIVEVMPSDAGLLVRLLFETGFRPSEIYGLRNQDVDYNRAVVRSRPNEERGLKTPPSERTVPISLELARDLKDRKLVGPLLFDDLKGVSKKTFRKVLQRAIVASGVVRHGAPIEITPKTFRKVNGTLLAVRGVPELTLQTRFGHSRGSRTLRKYYVWAEQYAGDQPIVTLPTPADK
jgi:integrase